ncbi:MAG: Transcriptional regulator of nonfermentable carbon utilization [Piccolia ochrophora]|nr:MAG: Transcriptional regulator of nonfermentable carbon utilization [Piccolia ochrophora]
MPPDDDDASASSDSNDNVGEGDMAEQESPNGRHAKAAGSSNGASAPPNLKDPLRPRRKKARRACHACQRAHLTCGDERPCQRCIKRGLQDTCHDGMRKKAKYLHDAPNEALLPGVAGHHFSNVNDGSNGASMTSPVNVVPMNDQASYQQMQSNSASAFGLYPPQPPSQMQPPLQDFSNQPSPMTPTVNTAATQPPTSFQNYNEQLAHAAQMSQRQPLNPFNGPMFDPNDPTMFNLDLQSYDFGNHYGALEFGMLGHMSSGAVETPPGDNTTSMSQTGTGFTGSTPLSTAYDQSPGSAGYGYGKDTVTTEWQGDRSRHGSTGNIYGNEMNTRSHPSVSHGYAIGFGPNSFPNSEQSSPQNMLSGFDGSALNSAYYSGALGTAPQQHMGRRPQQLKQPPLQQGSQKNPGVMPPHNSLASRSRDPSSIYESVKHPYSYTSGFHGLTAFLQRRFSPQKTLRIAKSMASIRPSFIACTKDLTQGDLVFMEKCFQRTLWEYEDFINACGTPTIVCRRTGEVAAVGKEFSILTGWSKEVLLGKAPNLNINTGGSSGVASAGGSSRGGFDTPRTSDKDGQNGNERPQPVFLAELLDDDSVIAFYEDFAKLAFGDSRGSVTTQCKLLKYKTKDGLALGQSVHRERMFKNENQDHEDDPKPKGATHKKRGSASMKSNQRGPFAGEASISGLESQDGKVECSYCWTVKRDVFDIPMLIVMNFLPCI